MTMPAKYGLAQMVFGDSVGKVMFLAVTDGKQAQYVNTTFGTNAGWDIEDEENEIAHALQIRVEMMLRHNPDGIDPEKMLRGLGYNMPLSIADGGTYPTMDEALAAARADAEKIDKETTA